MSYEFKVQSLNQAYLQLAYFTLRWFWLLQNDFYNYMYGSIYCRGAKGVCYCRHSLLDSVYHTAMFKNIIKNIVDLFETICYSLQFYQKTPYGINFTVCRAMFLYTTLLCFYLSNEKLFNQIPTSIEGHFLIHVN